MSLSSASHLQSTFLNKQFQTFTLHFTLFTSHLFLLISSLSFWWSILKSMMKTSKRSKQKASQEIEVAIDWEVRPGGMLVQKRVVGSDPGCVAAPIIKFKVSHESYHHHISLPSHSTFGNPLLSFFFTHLFGSTMSSLSNLESGLLIFHVIF